MRWHKLPGFLRQHLSLVAFISGLWLLFFQAGDSQDMIHIIPMPNKIEKKEGAFRFNNCTMLRVDTSDQGFVRAVTPLVTKIRQSTGIDLLSPQKCRMLSQINIVKDAAVASEEGYIIDITPSVIEVRASAPAGVFYAIQSLLQMLPVYAQSASSESAMDYDIPCVRIEDGPVYAYRGIMLDVARHYMPVDQIKRIIDVMAMQKMNRFHWHLTDSQGWRFESKKYPKLTETGAYRKGNPRSYSYDYESRKDDTLYGGYYTREQMLDVVKYAEERFITIIPEVEMPSHSRAALASYPQLACLDSNGKKFAYPSNIQDELCTGEETFTFITDILTEVMEIFPGKYIHIGGDEATKANWKKCPVCRDKMKTLNIKTVNELQSHFIARIDQFISEHGRQVIGWDEILQGGLAPNATVMSWRGEKGGIEAARLKHSFIMAPSSYCYLDYYQSNDLDEPVAWGGYLPLSKVYSYDPSMTITSDTERTYLLGVQGNLWTEHIPDYLQAQYMLFPRATALAEVGWTRPEHKNFENFLLRMTHYGRILDTYGIRYAHKMTDMKQSVTIDPEGAVVVRFDSIQAPQGSKLLYSYIDKIPASALPLYRSYFDDPAKIPFNDKGESFALAYKDGIKVEEDAKLLLTVTDPGSGFEYSRRRIEVLTHKAVGKKITYKIKPSDTYSKSGDQVILNGFRGNNNNYKDPEWLAWNGKVFEGTIDFDKPEKMDSIELSFYHNPTDWIWYPKSVEVSGSSDGINYTVLKQVSPERPDSKGGASMILHFKTANIRYLRIKANPLDKIPAGKSGAGRAPWMFVGEVVVR